MKRSSLAASRLNSLEQSSKKQAPELDLNSIKTTPSRTHSFNHASHWNISSSILSTLAAAPIHEQEITTEINQHAVEINSFEPRESVCQHLEQQCDQADVPVTTSQGNHAPTDNGLHDNPNCFNDNQNIPKSNRLFGIPEAPVFRPTAEEFTDPMAYIAQIRPLAEKTGICKVIPPAGWKPSFALDTTRFWFKTRMQELNSLGGSSRTVLNYLDQLQKFHQQQGTPFTHIPTLNKKPIDLHQLKLEVQKRGGYEQVSASKKWIEVGTEMGMDRTTCTSLSHSIRQAYLKFILPYEKFVEKHQKSDHSLSSTPISSDTASASTFGSQIRTRASRQENKDDMLKSELSDYSTEPSTKRSSTRRNTASNIISFTDHSMNVDDSESDDDYCDPNRRTSRKSRRSITSQSMPGTTSQANNSASLRQSSRISTVSSFFESKSQTPDDDDLEDQADNYTKNSSESEKETTSISTTRGRAKRPIKKTQFYDAGPAKGAAIIKREAVALEKELAKKARRKKYGKTCKICSREELTQKMLKCEDCKIQVHPKCLKPPLKTIPRGEWYCAKCILVSGNDYGFEDRKKLRSLSEFQKVADKFKAQWFHTYCDEQEEFVVYEDDIEKEFWRLIESPYNDIEVEYGADLHSSHHGSGFPTAEKQPLDPYSSCGWNLNNIPILPKSLFCHIRNDISGMMIPWLYVGMVFSTFCWHTEDHFSYSINYLHWGETKTWYGVPSSNAQKFEHVMRDTFPELFKQNPDLLFHITTMLSPKKLVDNGVEVFALDHHPGEFVITFPRSYHAGFNHGFNFAEAVNFTLPDWIPFAAQCEHEYHLYAKQPVFSLDELLISTARTKMTEDCAMSLRDSFAQMRQREIDGRHSVIFNCKIQIVKEKIGDHASDDDQCRTCKRYCYLSRVSCERCPGHVSCFAHVSKLCECEKPALVLQMRYTEEELARLEARVCAVAEKTPSWRNRLKSMLLEATSPPPLKSFVKLLKEAQHMPEVQAEVATLTQFIDQANAWVNSVKQVVHKPKRHSVKSNILFQHTTKSDRPTLSHIKCLFESSKTLAFDSAELKLLQILYIKVTEYCNMAQKVLDELPNVSDDTLEATYNSGQATGVATLQQSAIHLVMKQRSWQTRCSCTIHSSKGVTLENVQKLFKEGIDLSIPPTDSILSMCRDQIKTGEAWVVRATQLLNDKTITLDILDQFLLDSKNERFSSTVYDKLQSVSESAHAWVSRAQPYIDAIQQKRGNHTSVPTHQANMDELQALVVDGNLQSFPPPHFSLISEAVAQANQWTIRARRAFVGKSHQIADSLIELITEAIESSPPVLNSESDPLCYCICRKPDERGFMIECDRCNTWYHGQCIKTFKKEIQNGIHFACIVCDSDFTIQRANRRPPLELLLAVNAEAKNLELVPVEVGLLKTLVDMYTAWRVRVDAALTSHPIDHDLVRKFLRCAEGSTIGDSVYIARMRQVLFGIDIPEKYAAIVQAITNATRLYCLCRRPNGNELPMIGCDTCDEWFHFECVGLSVLEAEAISKYMCPNCRTRQPLKATLQNKKRPRKSTDTFSAKKRLSVVTALVDKVSSPSPVATNGPKKITLRFSGLQIAAANAASHLASALLPSSSSSVNLATSTNAHPSYSNTVGSSTPAHTNALPIRLKLSDASQSDARSSPALVSIPTDALVSEIAPETKPVVSYPSVTSAESASTNHATICANSAKPAINTSAASLFPADNSFIDIASSDPKIDSAVKMPLVDEPIAQESSALIVSTKTPIVKPKSSRVRVPGVKRADQIKAAELESLQKTLGSVPPTPRPTPPSVTSLSELLPHTPAFLPHSDTALSSNLGSSTRDSLAVSGIDSEMGLGLLPDTPDLILPQPEPNLSIILYQNVDHNDAVIQHAQPIQDISEMPIQKPSQESYDKMTNAKNRPQTYKINHGNEPSNQHHTTYNPQLVNMSSYLSQSDVSSFTYHQPVMISPYIQPVAHVYPPVSYTPSTLNGNSSFVYDALQVQHPKQ
ncbi:hypothetical protein MT418_006932 [Batrachochytrium dendrobatidis]